MGYSYQKGFGWPHLLFGLILFVVLLGIIIPFFSGSFSRAGGPRTEALNNAKAIAGGLVAFKADYGAYPCAETRELLRKKGVTTLSDRDDANAYLAQLIAAEIIDSETYFYAPGVKGAIKGDDLIGSADKLLSRGENGFAYIMTSDEEALSDVRSLTPLVIAPLKEIGKDGVPLFDPNPYADYYIYGCVDGSGRIGKISPTGLPLSTGRTHLFQTGTNSLFGNETPVVKKPLGF